MKTLLLFLMLGSLIAEPILLWETSVREPNASVCEAYTLTRRGSSLWVGGTEFYGTPDFSDIRIWEINPLNGMVIKDTAIGTGFPMEDKVVSVANGINGLWWWGWQQNGYFNYQGVLISDEWTPIYHLIWGTPEATSRAFGCCVNPDDGVAVTGEVPSWIPLPSQALALDVWDRNANHVLSFTWDSIGIQCGKDVLYLDHFYYVCGISQDKANVKEGVALKIREDGTLFWVLPIAFSGDNGLLSMVYNPTDTVIACVGYVAENNIYNGWLQCIHIDGYHSVTKIYQNPNYEMLTSITIDTSAHCYYLGGYRQENYVYKSLIRKIDYRGNIEWEWLYDNDSKIQDIEFQGNGEVAFCGMKGTDGWFGIISEAVSVPEKTFKKQDKRDFGFFDILGRRVNMKNPNLNGVIFKMEGESMKKIIIVK